MTSALDWIAGGSDDEHLDAFTLLVPVYEADPYNPAALVPDWAQEPAEIPFQGAWSSGSSSLGSDPVREQQTTTKTITVFDPDFPAAVTHRVRAADGSIYRITGKPENDRNPFTGWQPTLVLAVEEEVG